MLAEYERKTNIGVGIGILIQFFGRVLLGPDDSVGSAPLFGILLVFVGSALFIWGCMCYSKGKGHHRAWGLLGLLSIFGLVALFFFTDKHKKVKSG